MPDVGLNSFKNNILHLFLLIENRANSRAYLLNQLTDGTRGTALKCSLNSPAGLMSQYHKQRNLKMLDSILQAAEFGKPRNVTCNPHDKYFTEPLVQNVLGADPGVAAAKNGG